MTDHAYDITGLQIAADNLVTARKAYCKRIYDANENGMSVRAIAAVLDVSHQTVHNIVKAEREAGHH